MELLANLSVAHAQLIAIAHKTFTEVGRVEARVAQDDAVDKRCVDEGVLLLRREADRRQSVRWTAKL